MNKIQINKPKFKRGDIAYYIDKNNKINYYKILGCRIIMDVGDDIHKEKISHMYNIWSTYPNYDFNINENDLYLTKEEALNSLIEQITNDTKMLPNSWDD
jgi:hypothetical protein